MRVSLTTLPKFALAFALCTVACTAFWQLCIAHVYHCTDDISIGLDYLFGPGSWVHGIAAGGTERTGDTLDPGWTIARLRTIWFTLLTTSILVSATLSLFRWRTPPKPLEHLPGHFPMTATSPPGNQPSQP